MQYLITMPDEPPFLTNWYDFPNNFVEGMVIYNLTNFTYSYDGKTFIDIPEDHL